MKSPTDKHIILASNSPRRRQLLGYIVDDFTIAPSRDVDETYPADLAPDDVAPYLSRIKADAYADIIGPDDLLITADTVVILDGHILGKPRDEADAARMLSNLSGRTHHVVTGVTLRTADKTLTFSESTQVTFDDIDSDRIAEYVAQYRPMDKAGAYGIQEWIGAAAIRSITGCFYNVMGLPLNSLYRHLSR